MEGADVNETQSPILFPEFDLVMEPEEIIHKNQPEDDEEAEKRRLKEYDELLKSGKAGNLNEIPDSELEKYGGESSEDKTFTKFKKRIQSNPDQVLRYERDGLPLWITSKYRLKTEEIPACSNCNSARTFEFQIMPQLLNSMKHDELDWGVITVYTCSNDCDIKDSYVEEFAYKQDILREENETTNNLLE